MPPQHSGITSISQAKWMSLGEAVRHTFTSMNTELCPVDYFQRDRFAALGLKRRDPMYVTMMTCLDLEACQTTEACSTPLAARG